MGWREPPLVLVRLFVLTVLMTGNVYGSHFRGGTISWKSLGGTQVQFVFRMGWVYGRGPGCTEQLKGQLVTGMSSSYWTCQTNNCAAPNGQLHTLNYICMGASQTENWEQGVNNFIFTFPGTGPFTIGFDGGDWINLSNGKGGSNWNVATTVDLRTRSDTGTPNSSPESLSKPMYYVQFDCEVRLKIPVVDPDDDVIRCRWSQGNECKSVCNALPFAQLDEETCTLVFNSTLANQYTQRGIYAVAVTIEDYPRIPMTLGGSTQMTPSDALSTVPLQFLLTTIPQPGPCDAGPRFVPPTPEENDVITVEEGDEVIVPVFADNGNDTSSKADKISVSGPRGMAQTPVIPDPNRNNTFTTNATWQTSDADIGNHIVCAIVTNDKGKSGEQRCFKIEVVPKGCGSSPCQNSGKCVAKNGNYTCICRPGFTGQNCQIDIDDCVSNQCPSGTLCVDGINTFMCLNITTTTTTTMMTTTTTAMTTIEKNYTGMCPIEYEHCDCTIRPNRNTRSWMGLSRKERDVLFFSFGFPIGLVLSVVTFFCLFLPCERRCHDHARVRRQRRYKKS